MSTRNMFSWRNKKNVMLIPILSGAMNKKIHVCMEKYHIYTKLNKLKTRIRLSIKQFDRDPQCLPFSQHYLDCTMRKRVFGYMRTAKAQISLCICTVRSGSSQSSSTIMDHCRMYQWRANAQMRLCTCKG